MGLQLLPHRVQLAGSALTSQRSRNKKSQHKREIQYQKLLLDHVLCFLCELVDVLALEDLNKRLDDGDSLQDVLEGLGLGVLGHDAASELAGPSPGRRNSDDLQEETVSRVGHLGVLHHGEEVGQELVVLAEQMSEMVS